MPEPGQLHTLMAGVGGRGWFELARERFSSGLGLPALVWVDLLCWSWRLLLTVLSSGWEMPHLTPGLNRQLPTPPGGVGHPLSGRALVRGSQPWQVGKQAPAQSPFLEGELHQLPGTLPEFCSELVSVLGTLVSTPLKWPLSYGQIKPLPNGRSETTSAAGVLLR